MKRYALLLAYFLAASTAWGRQAMSPGPLNVRSANGTVSNYPYQLKFPNGDVTDNADGTMTIADSTSALSSSAILLSSTLQSGATFFVSSGTVNNLNVSSMTSTLPMSANKITGMAAATAAGDGVRYEQWHMAANVIYAVTTSSYAIPSTALVTLTNLTATITPSLSTSKVLARLCIEIDLSPTSGNKQYMNIQLLRGGSLVSTWNEVATAGGAILASETFGSTVCLEYLDSPGAAASTVYTVKAGLDATSPSGTGAINGVAGGTANSSSISLMEIPL